MCAYLCDLKNKYDVHYSVEIWTIGGGNLRGGFLFSYDSREIFFFTMIGLRFEYIISFF